MNTNQKNEIFEVVDRNGNTIKTATRQECHSNPKLIHKAVHCMVFNEKGEIFLQKRSSEKKIQPGKWDTSVGGHLLAGEDFETALKRETKEELGIELKNFDFLYNYIWESPVETEFIKTYKTHITPDDKIKINKDELDDGRFWNKEILFEKIGNNPEIFTPNFLYEVQLLKKNAIL